MDCSIKPIPLQTECGSVTYVAEFLHSFYSGIIESVLFNGGSTEVVVINTAVPVGNKLGQFPTPKRYTYGFMLRPRIEFPPIGSRVLVKHYMPFRVEFELLQNE